MGMHSPFNSPMSSVIFCMVLILLRGTVAARVEFKVKEFFLNLLQPPPFRNDRIPDTISYFSL
jgi:hypothetical protein